MRTGRFERRSSSAFSPYRSIENPQYWEESPVIHVLKCALCAWACPGHSICLRQQAKTQNNDEDSGPTCKVLNYHISSRAYALPDTQRISLRKGRSAALLRAFRGFVPALTGDQHPGNAKDWQQGNYCVAQATCLAGTIATSTRMHVTLEDMPAVCSDLSRTRLGPPQPSGAHKLTNVRESQSLRLHTIGGEIR